MVRVFPSRVCIARVFFQRFRACKQSSRIRCNVVSLHPARLCFLRREMFPRRGNLRVNVCIVWYAGIFGYERTDKLYREALSRV